MYPTFQPRAGQWHHVRNQSRDGAEGVREAAVGESHSGLAVAAAQDGGEGEGWLRQVEQGAQAGLWSCAMDAAGIPHGAVHPAAVAVKGRC